MTDHAAHQPPIIFGTDGWRARIGEDYTYENVRRCAQGVAEWVQQQGTTAKGVVLGYDRRFSSEYFAAAAAEVLLAYDIPVAIAEGPIPTQMTSYEVVEQGFACGVMITASHNPWTDNGFKIKSPSGAAASADILTVVEAAIRCQRRCDAADAPHRRWGGGRSGPTLRSVSGLRRVPRPIARPGAAEGGGHARPRRPDVGRRCGLDPRLLAGGRIRRHGDPLGAQPLVRGRQPGAHRAQHR